MSASFPPAALRHTASLALMGGLILAAMAAPALAQGGHHPFAVGASEGAVGHVSGIGAWIIARESSFYLLLTGSLRAAKENGAALWALLGLSFGYGVFHAAGPGHGKAVIASYMVSNERALRRGLVISLVAAVLQGFVAIGLVGIAAAIFATTASRMTEAAHIMEIASYVGILALGVALLWSKGAGLIVALRRIPAAASLGIFAAAAPPIDDGRAFGSFRTKGTAVIDSEQSERDFRGKPVPTFPNPALAFASGTRPAGTLTGGALQGSGFIADDGDGHVHGPDCGHFHAPDPRQLGDGFSWRSALLTVVTAGARPCSGAILVLVFSLAQGIFWAGAAATFAMSLGTAITTGALASFAVLAKGWALRVSGRSSWRAEIIGRCIEVGAALCVIFFGGALLIAALSGVASGA